MTEFRSLAEVFLNQVQQRPAAEAFRAPADDGGWTRLTWRQTEEQGRHYAGGLIALGVQIEDRVAIASTTRLEWCLADLGVILAGAATTTIYPASQTGDVSYILADSGSGVAIVEDAVQLAKLRESRAELPDLRTVVVIDTDTLGDPGDDGTWDDGWVISLTALAERGRSYLADNPDAVEARVEALTPEHLSTLIYTSGTTGRPKGVELLHRNWIYVGDAAQKAGIVNPDDVQFLWLPLSHVFGKLLLAAQYYTGFSTTVDGRIDKIVDNLAVVRPTLMASAPRIFEKIYARVNSMTDAEGGAKAKIFHWAFGVGIQALRLEQAGKPVPPALKVQRAVADRLVFSKIRARLGGNIRSLVSGSAALAPEIAEWFAAAGLPILEGYGMTEGTAAFAVNRPGGVRIGTVGHPMNGAEIKLAEDGEILFRSPGVMRGYWHLPEQTKESLTDDGWLLTGDVGEIDPDGALRITDRKKDMVKTSGGKFIAPSAIEGSIKAGNPMLGQVVVIADGRRFASALITLDIDAVNDYAGRKGIPAEKVYEDPEVVAGVQATVDAVNSTLNRWETIKQFRLLPRELDVESGEMTPSLKIKRGVVGKNHADVIEEMYR